MSLHPQSIENNALSALKHQAGARISGSIEQASAKTGVDFAYLMQQAGAESSFQTDVKAKTSSATGLFQFIDSTWISMVDRYGEQYGIDKNQPKSDLLELRNDPEISSYMAGELAKENKQTMGRLLSNDIEIGSTELYFAHFMGPSSAAGFLQARNDSPNLNGADLFPKEAQANKAVFFDANQRPRSLEEIYQKFDTKFSIQAPQTTQDVPTIQTASVSSEVTESIRPTYSKNNPLSYIQRSNPYLDLLAPTTPLKTSNTSSITSIIRNDYGFNSLLQNPADLLWLTALEDSLGDNKNL